MAEKHLSFPARVIPGSGKGRAMGFPTLNVDLSTIPFSLQEGIYAVQVTIEAEQFLGAMHYGNRPVHHLPKSCEVHIIDATLEKTPSCICITVLQRLRDVRSFPTERQLCKQIAKDVEEVKGYFL